LTFAQHPGHVTLRFPCFGPLKKHLKGKRFNLGNELKHAIEGLSVVTARGILETRNPSAR